MDLLDLIAQEEAASAEWAGAPLGFTTDFWPVGDLMHAFEHWEVLNPQRPSYRASRMWRPALTVPSARVHGHDFDLLIADLRCEHRERCECVGGLYYRASCDECRWHVIADRENAAVEAWHDHAMPGWRDLPVMTSVSAATDRQPDDWRFDGAPIRTLRTSPGNRHVPGRSPFGGYDLAAEAVA